MYASLLGISDTLHLDVFDQPAMQVLFSNLLGFGQGDGMVITKVMAVP